MIDTQDTSRVLPFIIEKTADFSLQQLLANLRQDAEPTLNQLQQHGALLFRNFEINTSEQFKELIKALGVNISEQYPLGISPRSSLMQGVFNATEIPGCFPLFAHNEMAYLKVRPALISFYCAIAPTQWGETPLFDTVKAFNYLNDKTKALLLTKRFKYTHIYSKKLASWNLGFELTWPNIFQTDDKTIVSQYLQEQGYAFQWDRKDKLTYSTITPPVLECPQSGTYSLNLQLPHWYTMYRLFKLLHNRQNVLLNYSLMAATLIRYACKQMATFLSFDDDTPISYAIAKELYEALWKSVVIFPWQQNDVLVVDNKSVAHGRMNVIQPRQIMVILGNMYSVESPA